MYCFKCGNELEENAKFCGKCGTKVEGSNQAPLRDAITYNEPEQNEKYTGKEMLERIGKIITFGLSIISVVMIIGAFIGKFNNNPVPFIIFITIVIIFGKIEDKFPRIPTITIAVLEVIALIVCFSVASNVETIEMVRGGKPEAYPNITYERAFENYFSEITWKNAGKDEDGNKVVKFTGNCYYLDEAAVAEIKFTVYEDQGRFVVSSVKLDGQEMGILGNALIMAAFEEY